MPADEYGRGGEGGLSAHQFLEMLFGKLPEFLRDEAELRALWSDRDTRAIE